MFWELEEEGGGGSYAHLGILVLVLFNETKTKKIYVVSLKLYRSYVV